MSHLKFCSLIKFLSQFHISLFYIRLSVYDDGFLGFAQQPFGVLNNKTIIHNQ